MRTKTRDININTSTTTKNMENSSSPPSSTIPSFFRCPISLDVMRSPVSLCTGVTYDRSSIQQWLDSGNNTCPATMQVLPSKDFIPNLTLHRLINLWSSSPSPSSSPRLPPLPDLLRDLQSSTTANTHHLLSSLSSFAASSDRNRASLSLSPCPSVLLSLLARHGNDDGDLSVLAGAARVLSLLNLTDPIPETPPIARALSRLLRADGSPDSRVDAARVLDSLARSSPDARLALASSDYGLLPLLLRMLDETHTPSAAVDAALACLITLSAPRRARAQVVRLGVVPKLTRILLSDLPAETVERALKMMETASTCTEGRAAICGEEGCVGAVLGRVLKGSAAATEHATVVLWSVCCLFWDKRARDAVAKGGNGSTKMLLLMQGSFSPAVREMAGDLLKIFRVSNPKCGITGYETKTTHIMPF